MVSKEHRFHGIASLRFVYRRGHIVRGPLFAVKYAENKKRGTYRAAVVVSKKISKSAVVRNRIRRRIYEAIRLFEGQYNAPYDIVITVYSEQVATIEAKKLEYMLTVQLKKAQLIS